MGILKRQNPSQGNPMSDASRKEELLRIVNQRIKQVQGENPHNERDPSC